MCKTKTKRANTTKRWNWYKKCRYILDSPFFVCLCWAVLLFYRRVSSNWASVSKWKLASVIFRSSTLWKKEKKKKKKQKKMNKNKAKQAINGRNDRFAKTTIPFMVHHGVHSCAFVLSITQWHCVSARKILYEMLCDTINIIHISTFYFLIRVDNLNATARYFNQKPIIAP